MYNNICGRPYDCILIFSLRLVHDRSVWRVGEQHIWLIVNITVEEFDFIDYCAEGLVSTARRGAVSISAILKGLTVIALRGR